MLIAKVTIFAVLMTLAALNRWRYGPALASTPSFALAFQRTVAVEYVLICAVLTVTAIMTTLFSPNA
jgi:putative copper export protein